MENQLCVNCPYVDTIKDLKKRQDKQEMKIEDTLKLVNNNNYDVGIELAKINGRTELILKVVEGLEKSMEKEQKDLTEEQRDLKTSVNEIQKEPVNDLKTAKAALIGGVVVLALDIIYKLLTGGF